MPALKKKKSALQQTQIYPIKNLLNYKFYLAILDQEKVNLLGTETTMPVILNQKSALISILSEDDN